MKNKLILAAAISLIAGSALAQTVRPMPASSITSHRFTSVYVAPVQQAPDLSDVARAGVNGANLNFGRSANPFGMSPTYMYACAVPGLPTIGWAGTARDVGFFAGAGLVLEQSPFDGRPACSDGRPGYVTSILSVPNVDIGGDGPQ